MKCVGYGGRVFLCSNHDGHIWHVRTYDPWKVLNRKVVKPSFQPSVSESIDLENLMLPKYKFCKSFAAKPYFK